MSKRRKTISRLLAEPQVPGYDQVLGNVVELLESARRAAARSVNALITATYWEIGRQIVEFEQGGSEQAHYGTVLVTRLASDLTQRFGRGFSKSNLYQMRSFYLAYRQIFQTASGTFAGGIFQTLSGKSAERTNDEKRQTASVDSRNL